MDAILELRDHFLPHLDSIVQHMFNEDVDDKEEWEKYREQYTRVRSRVLHPKILALGGQVCVMGDTHFEELCNFDQKISSKLLNTVY